MSRLIAVVGPSGAGKDTLIAGALAVRPGLVWAQRVITRPESAGGEPYRGVTRDVFDRMLAEGAFAVHWDAHGLSYGVPVEELAKGDPVLFNGSRLALEGIRRTLPDLGVIWITAPAEVLAERLAARGRETPDDIARRLARADLAAPKAAEVVRNDASPETGVARFLGALDRLRQADQPDSAKRSTI